MNKNTFYVIEEENEEGKSLAHAEKVPNCYNLLGSFQPYKGFKIISINACDTWKEAEKIAHIWNEAAKKKGKYAF